MSDLPERTPLARALARDRPQAEVIAWAAIPVPDWELDTHAALIREDDTFRLVTTNHGKLLVVVNPVRWLWDRIGELGEMIGGITTLLREAEAVGFPPTPFDGFKGHSDSSS